MSMLMRIMIVVAGMLLIGLTVKSLVSRELTERQSLFWILCGLIVMIFGFFPGLSILIAKIFRVNYVPSIIFSSGLILAMYGIFSCFRAIAGLHKRVQELAMQVSLLNHENGLLLRAQASREQSASEALSAADDAAL